MSTRFAAVHDRRPVRSDSPENAVVLSIIIATYNAHDLLVDCVQSIYRNPPREPYEIIVVDDASTDRTSKTVEACFPEARLLRNEINTHYATANNRAFGVASGRYLYLLNNDTIVLPDALDRMLAFLRENPEAGAVGSRLLNEDGTIQWSVKSLPNPGSALFGARSILTRLFPQNPYSARHLLHLSRDMSAPFVAGYVSSASIMLPREVVERVGGLDTRLSYHVDADYCKRIADAGYQCYYLPSALIVHLNHKGGTMVTFSRRIRSILEFHIGSYIYYRKHVRRSRWSPMPIIVGVCLFGRFVASLGTQAIVEVLCFIRPSRQPGQAEHR
jgi:N-acetylglucosaminyl-diphospho-decaprenol L-rhamnosyltransferase